MSEHQQQAALFQWAAMAEVAYPELDLMFAIPNQGKRPGLQGKWMVDEGLKFGIPDIFLPAARNRQHGFFIEMKDGRDKKPTPAQRHRIVQLRIAGYKAEVYGDWEDAKEAIIQYLEGR